MGRTLFYCAGAFALAAAGIYLNNSSLLAEHRPGKPVLLAHRGLAQRFDETDLKNDTCTASRMLPPKHDYLENTIRSMQAGFAAGADIVEIDVHPTTDGQFAVFHDWTLDCRTDGHGVTREQAMADMKKLDIGYRYTADGGKSFPFRGRGLGMMPTLAEVLSTFPNRRFLINVKSRDPSEGEKLAAVLIGLSTERRAEIIVYGGDEPIDVIRRRVPDIKTASRQSLKGCLTGYIGYGWTGLLPDACKQRMMLVPINIAPWLWGWPDRFLNRMQDAGTEVFVLGPYRGSDFSTGIDDTTQLSQLPQNFSAGIWTNDIEAIGKAMK
ncbi:glycerophosphodiester phosphodiesterase family protein [Rhizobium lentis]|uniref:Glycerophosphoryl diester phosphodiesterase n=1 Tax=Rhizobium lentis TaxID=1138194 RepID=A0A7W8XK04_9HYPH|nr:glycerophosphodiester phosphodiesterase family protein [Rhizobium lentis]MBB4577190.1 glycerophosphoryl diester phosphodiesterase [Rhizobium lentis]MBB5553753.1 glycerophosphoryl diester phosphodiesterase [Rhizobium lentis]MBB5564276.1 glycerophosphoryl diester phosphodiesterase [Rhizobium lentis]MBB5570799.1 glycerophosphoryl diester phosphodiesterase [Rhizobium lentis]